MYELKCCVNVLLIAVVIRHSHLISVGSGSQTDKIIWNLSQFAVENKQNYKQPSESQLHPEKFSRYAGQPEAVHTKVLYQDEQNVAKQNPPQLHYRPHPFGHYQQYRPDFPRPIPALPPGYQPQSQSLTNALQSLAQNDELQCVPRLLCELVSSPSSEVKSMLPFNIDFASVLRFLPLLSGTESSPVLEFGKAALVGYTSKGNVDSCSGAYPDCPKDPDKLVEYLNNYNGGFFRFFNGRPMPGFPKIKKQRPNRPYRLYYPLSTNDRQYVNNYNRKTVNADRRIQTKPSEYFNRPVKGTIRFPSTFKDIIPEVQYNPELVFFESNNGIDDYQNFRELPFRQQKGLTFPNNDLQLGYIKPISMVFPDRTGTGELKLDEDEFNISPNDYF